MKHDIRNGPSSNHAQFSFDSFLLLRWRDISQIEHTQDCSHGRQILWARDWVRRNGPTFLLKQPCVNKRRCSVSVAFPLLFGWFETSPISRYNRCRYVGIFSHRFFFVIRSQHATCYSKPCHSCLEYRFSSRTYRKRFVQIQNLKRTLNSIIN